jgi:DNA-binding transcriptional ArsR family regulator
MNLIIKEEEGIQKYDSCQVLSQEQFSLINHPLKFKILDLLNKKPMFISELADELKLNEQNIYYHMKALLPFLEITEQKKIRGTVAKKYKPKNMNFCLCLSNNFKKQDVFLKNNDINKKEKHIEDFFSPFITDGIFNSKIIVGSPDLHGPHKARARDGHYAIDLAMYLGNFSIMPEAFTVALDVDISLKELDSNIIVVGGPVTNLIMGSINNEMPIKFVEGKQWAIKGKKALYSDDNMGLITRFKNPFFQDKWILVLAGIRYSGTKATVLALTRNTKLALNHFTSQKDFYAIIQGFDLDGDGKIDSVELLESS